MTKSSRRRSSAATPGAVVFASHCCGTTRPSGPIASRTTWIQARSSTKPQRASSPVRGHAMAWFPRLSTRARQPARDGQRQTHAAPERKVHQIRRRCRGRVSRDGGKPSLCMWACLGAQQRTVAGPNGWQQDMLSERGVKCESSIPLPAIRPFTGLATRCLRRC